MHQGARVNRGKKRREEHAPRCAHEPGREEQRRGESTPRACPPFMERGSTSLLEASQKGVFLTPDSVTPRVHQSGTSRPTPPPSHSSQKQAGKIRAPIGTPLVSFRVRRFSTRLVVCVEVGCMLGVVVWMAWLLRCGCGDVDCSKIMTAKEKRLSQRITALLTRIIPSEQRWGLTEQILTGITELGTLMVYCKFPQP